MWMLNELASPYGDHDQKLASHFLQALVCKVTDSGTRCYKTLVSVAEKADCFESARKVILKFQEVSPWTTFGHVAANGAILDAMEGEAKIHIIDISNTYCTQWPTLLEALATRSDETPRLRLTVVTPNHTSTTTGSSRSVMQEINLRMEKFARLMGVPFEFHVVSGLSKLGELSVEDLDVREDEAVAINCVGALRRVELKEREAVVRTIRSVKPKVVTIVEEEADFTSNKGDFVKCFDECLRFYGLLFEMLEESFEKASNERLVLERECSRSLIGLLACEGDGGGERREKGGQWCERMREGGFSPAKFTDDLVDDVKALLKRYRGGWSFVEGKDVEGECNNGLYLMWKEEMVVWASAWKPRS